MIRVDDVRLILEKRTILDRVTLEVGRGESVALVGPNGSGKTSVLRSILGLVPFQGRITIDGYDVRTSPIEARARMAYLPQRPAFGSASAREIVFFAADVRRIPRSKASEALERVGLAPHAKETARNFSGGMQQRLSFALALLSDGPVFLLDEPTASLDREGQRAFIEIALELRRTKRTLLLASHRSEEIARIADRVLTIEHGTLVDEPVRAPVESDAGVANVIPIAAHEGLLTEAVKSGRPKTGGLR
jgi:ABC-type multidrug transport system ATPase subunit